MARRYTVTLTLVDPFEDEDAVPIKDIRATIADRLFGVFEAPVKKITVKKEAA